MSRIVGGKEGIADLKHPDVSIARGNRVGNNKVFVL
jgi:hypothetical protein